MTSVIIYSDDYDKLNKIALMYDEYIRHNTSTDMVSLIDKKYSLWLIMPLKVKDILLKALELEPVRPNRRREFVV